MKPTRIQTREQAEAAMDALSVAAHRLARLEADMNLKLTAVREKYEEEMAGLASAVKTETERLRAWADAHPEEFDSSRSVKLLHGVVGYRLGNTLTDNGSVARGECHATPEGYLDKIVERTKLFKEEGGAYFEEDGETVHLPNDTVVSMNFWGFTPKVFEGLSEDFAAFIDDPAREPLKSECLLPNTIGKMIKAGDCDVQVLTTSAKWFGVTYANDKPDVIAKLKALIAAGEYPNGLWK